LFSIILQKIRNCFLNNDLARLGSCLNSNLVEGMGTKELLT